MEISENVVWILIFMLIHLFSHLFIKTEVILALKC
jgi:hypothetical protein